MLRVLIVLLSLSPMFAHADAVQRLRAFFQSTAAMRAEFQQTVFDNQGRKMQEVSGSMQLQRPGKFRWDYNQPYVQVIVGDGQKVWLYDPDLEQVTVRALDKMLGSSPAALLAGGKEIDKTFNLKDLGRQEALEWAEATPKEKESGFERVLLGFGNDGLQQMNIHDSFGHVTVIEFSKLERNPRLQAQSFKFTPPAGVDVLSE